VATDNWARQQVLLRHNLRPVASRQEPIWEESHGMVYPENVDSGRSNFQLDTRSSGRRGNLDYLQTQRTLSFLS
jgi:hypothetical protein